MRSRWKDGHRSEEGQEQEVALKHGEVVFDVEGEENEDSGSDSDGKVTKPCTLLSRAHNGEARTLVVRTEGGPHTTKKKPLEIACAIGFSLQ